MTTIDHRILIPAAPQLVWDYISDITRNPDWQVDCREVIFLTSRREGPGLRWRYATPDNHEYVIAVTAWYNGLGYEYYFVDGTPFKENRGRIRLQEIPEGTVVQWTFTYELGGILSGVRNALGLSRQIDRTITDSLKALWGEMKKASAGQSHEAKSLIREAPDVEARSAYQPRHPSVMSQTDDKREPYPLEQSAVVEPPISEDDGQPIRVIDEPPIADDDTRPRPAASVPSYAPPVPPDIEDEPEFLENLEDFSRFEPPREPSDTQPRVFEFKPETAPPAEGIEATPAAETVEETEAGIASETVETENDVTQSREEVRDAAEDLTEPLSFRPPEVLPGYPTLITEEDREAVSTQPEPATENEQDPVAPTEPKTEAGEKPASATPTAEAAPEPSESASIWEIFGVPRPSEIQQASDVDTEATAKPAAPPSSTIPETLAAPERIIVPTAPDHTGLRVRLRRRAVKLRRF